ncbi:MAG: thioesterase family protein [Pseudomonadota bacterium]
MARQAPFHRDAFHVFTAIQTRWSDNDVYGHLNNTVHYQLFDTVLTGWLIRKGLLKPTGSDFVTLVVETGCSFFAELSFPQTLDAGLRVDRLGRTSITYGFALFADGDTAAAQGHLTHVMVERTTRKPRVLPDVWIKTLKELQPGADLQSAAREPSRALPPASTETATLGS